MSQAPERPIADEVTFLRHTLATLAYRAEKVLREPPAGFEGQRIGPKARTPLEIAAHLADLMEWASSLADGQWTWKAGGGGSWETEVARFYAALGELDRKLASGRAPGHPPGVIFQGPVADALTHVGQIAFLRGLAGDPVRPESYGRAEIAAGRVGREQSGKRREFDGDASARDRPRA